MNHRIGSYVFALGVGVLVAFLSYRWITDPTPRLERAVQESVVLAARDHLTGTVADGDLEIVDPLTPDRKVGKVYVYRAGDGWEVSGYYRRSEDDSWHPFLMSLDATQSLLHLKVRDAALAQTAQEDARLDASP